MSEAYTRELTVDFRDLDINGHVKNTAYLAYATDTRYAYFAAHDVPAAELARRGIGPVVLHDEISYLKEIHVSERITVNFGVTRIDEDRRKMHVYNEIHKADGTLSCRIESLVAWFDIGDRKISTPPDDLYALIERIKTG